MQDLVQPQKAIELFLRKEGQLLRTYIRPQVQNLPQEVTYSRNVFAPVTHLCKDRCSYCAFRQDDLPSPYMTEKDLLNLVQVGRAKGCSEVLLTGGQSPEGRFSQARKWLDERGYSCSEDYYIHLCQLVLDEGLLPHVNVGVTTLSYLKRLAEVAISGGLMLESVATGLRVNPDGPHQNSPSKDPSLRTQVLVDAGKARFPFTTGLLLGIGEARRDVVDAFLLLREIQDQYGHLQEVILQPFTPHSGTLWSNRPPCPLDYLLEVVRLAVGLLPDIPLQVPPNLQPTSNQLLLQVGCRDFGGISPVTPDHVNPTNSWPSIHALESSCSALGLTLRERLPVYPKYLREEGWVRPRVAHVLCRSGLARKDGYRCAGPNWSC